MRALEFGSQFQLASEGGHSDPYDESIMNVFGYVLGQQIAQPRKSPQKETVGKAETKTQMCYLIEKESSSHMFPHCCVESQNITGHLPTTIS